jgi:acetylglutamate kinase
VGQPAAESDCRLLETLLRNRFVPVVASIGVDSKGRLLNVNADTLGGHLASRLRARRLVIAGTSAGVLGADGAPIPGLDASGIARLVADQTVTAGMVAKLRACELALAAGVEDVVIVDGRDAAALEAAASGGTLRKATRLRAGSTIPGGPRDYVAST